MAGNLLTLMGQFCDPGPSVWIEVSSSERNQPPSYGRPQETTRPSLTGSEEQLFLVVAHPCSIVPTQCLREATLRSQSPSVEGGRQDAQPPDFRALQTRSLGPAWGVHLLSGPGDGVGVNPPQSRDVKPVPKASRACLLQLTRSKGDPGGAECRRVGRRHGSRSGSGSDSVTHSPGP